jgi:hypothetical protein
MEKGLGQKHVGEKNGSTGYAFVRRLVVADHECLVGWMEDDGWMKVVDGMGGIDGMVRDREAGG